MYTADLRLARHPLGMMTIRLLVVGLWCGGAVTTMFACVFCGTRGGERNRLVVVECDGVRGTSLAPEPALTECEQILLVHGRCTRGVASRKPARSM